MTQAQLSGEHPTPRGSTRGRHELDPRFGSLRSTHLVTQSLGGLWAILGFACNGTIEVWPDRLTIVGAPSSQRLIAGLAGPEGLRPVEVIETSSSDESVAAFEGGRARARAAGRATLFLEASEGVAEVEVEVLPLSPFATRVIRFEPGEGAGFGAERFPEVVLGPPKGGGLVAGSFDVLSLGAGGRIELGFDVMGADGPGPDLVVFENAFQVSSSTVTFAEPAFVEATDGSAVLSFASAAGIEPVIAGSEGSTIDPADPRAGGDRFDLSAACGANDCRSEVLASIERLTISDASGGPGVGTSTGFDLDAVMLLNPVPREVDVIEASEPALQLRVGDELHVPRFDAIAGDRRFFGVAAVLWVEPVDAHVSLECISPDPNPCDDPAQLSLRGRAIGSATLHARLGSTELKVPIEVVP
ncbi:MAG: hypothetical protein HYV07_09560 [Deltaproteobacteria bacterium]|nr:hypothetical protein [Deltaproteobacteria bacterium]